MRLIVSDNVGRTADILLEQSIIESPGLRQQWNSVIMVHKAQQVLY